MPETRKLVRDGIVSILTDGTNGLNANLVSIFAAYGLSGPPSIDFSDTTQFFQGFVAPDSEKISAMASAGEEQVSLALALYTTTQEQGPNRDGFQKSRRFSGPITAILDFYFVWRTGFEQTNVELMADVLEDAVLTAFNAIQIQTRSAGVNWSGDYKCERDSIELLGDGYRQRIPIELIFEVNV